MSMQYLRQIYTERNVCCLFEIQTEVPVFYPTMLIAQSRRNYLDKSGKLDAGINRLRSDYKWSQKPVFKILLFMYSNWTFVTTSQFWEVKN